MKTNLPLIIDLDPQNIQCALAPLVLDKFITLKFKTNFTKKSLHHIIIYTGTYFFFFFYALWLRITATAKSMTKE